MPAPVDNFEPCLAAVWTFDGLRDDRATGEKFATSYGVTEMTWRMAQRAGVVKGPIANATKAQCEAVLRALYWNHCQCAALPIGVDLMVFNDAVLTGPSRSIGLLQRCVDVDDDGWIGPVTLQAVKALQPEILIKRIHDADDKYLASLHNSELFLKGWDRREDFMRTTALKMIQPKAKQ